MGPDDPDSSAVAPDPSVADPPAGDELSVPPSGELRGKDLVTRSREEVAAALDPSTLAELASWFERPSAALIVEAEAEDAAARALRALAERLAADADPALLALLERHNQMPDRLLPPRPPIKLHLRADVVPGHVRAALDSTLGGASVADAREYEPPADIARALEHDNAPQAILRDLYRPVQEYDRRLVAMFDSDEAAPLYRVGSAMGEREPIEWLGRGIEVLAKAREQFRAIIREPWSDHHAAVAARRAADREAAS